MLKIKIDTNKKDRSITLWLCGKQNQQQNIYGITLFYAKFSCKVVGGLEIHGIFLY